MLLGIFIKSSDDEKACDMLCPGTASLTVDHLEYVGSMTSRHL
jgi:hypothetical protein